MTLQEMAREYIGQAARLDDAKARVAQERTKAELLSDRLATKARNEGLSSHSALVVGGKVLVPRYPRIGWEIFEAVSAEGGSDANA